MHRSLLSLCVSIALATTIAPGSVAGQETGATAGPNKNVLLGDTSSGAAGPNKEALVSGASRGAALTKAAAPGVAAGPNKKASVGEASRAAVVKLQGGGVAGQRGTASDIWVGTDGGWHMDGAAGRGIYSGFGGLWDEQYVFIDELPVGARQGWTYKEVAFEIYIFFGSVGGQGDCSGERPFDIMWSTDNVNFNPFQCSR